MDPLDHIEISGIMITIDTISPDVSLIGTTHNFWGPYRHIFPTVPYETCLSLYMFYKFCLEVPIIEQLGNH